MRYIVVMQKGVDKAEYLPYLTSLGADIVNDYGALYQHIVIECPPDIAVRVQNDTRTYSIKLAGTIMSLGTVSHGTEPHVMTLEGGPTQNISLLSNGWGGNWGLARICRRKITDMPTAWLAPTGDEYPRTSDYFYVRDGSGVDVYVVDTGLAPITQFSGRYNMLHDSYRTVGDEAYGVDVNGHGTHVASIIASSFFGVAKGATIQVCRVFDSSSSTTYESVLNGIDAALTHHLAKISSGNKRPSVMNLSLGGDDTALNVAVDSCINNGIVVCAAAGNSGLNLDAPGNDEYPAEIARAITVAACAFGNANIGVDRADMYDSFWESTNYGTMIDVVAPGYDICASAMMEGYGTRMSGTSMATPHVAGVVALRLQKYDIGTTATYVQEIHDWIVANATTGCFNPEADQIIAGTPNRLLYSEYVSRALRQTGAVRLMGLRYT